MRPRLGLREAVRRFGADARGSVAALVVGFGLCMIAALALALDVSNVYLERRDAQGAVDLAAIAAARDIPNAERAARATLAANGFAAPKSFALTLGAYTPDPATAVQERFKAGATPTNAAGVEITFEAPLYFGGALLSAKQVTLKVNATAAATRSASFSIGSRLASLDGGVANALLSGMLGASVSLSAMDYRSLADATVDMADVLNALAPRVGVTGGSYDDVLATKPTTGVLAKAVSSLGDLDGMAKAALLGFANSGSSRTVDMGQLASLGPFGELAVGAKPGVSAKVAVLDLLTTAAGIANGSSQVSLNLGAQVPGLAGLTASVAVGERPQGLPWLAYGSESVTVRTAQTRLRLIAQVGGGSVLSALTIRLPVAVDVASAKATLTATSCGANPRTDAKATLDVTPSVADIWLGEPRSAAGWADFSKTPDIGPATLLDVLSLITAKAQAHVAVTNLKPTAVTFNATDIAKLTAKTVSTSDAAQSTLASLTRGLAVEVKLGLLGLALGPAAGLQTLIAATLSPVGTTLDPVLNGLLRTLGVGIGQADVTVRGLRCDGSALVG